MADLQSQLDILSKSKKEVKDSKIKRVALLQKGYYRTLHIYEFWSENLSKIGKIGQIYVMSKLHKTKSSGFIGDRPPGILNQDDFARL